MPPVQTFVNELDHRWRLPPLLVVCYLSLLVIIEMFCIRLSEAKEVKSSGFKERFYISMAGNWTSWSETGQLTSFAKNVVIALIHEEGSQSLNILNVGKWTLFDRKLRNFSCIFMKL